jgi:type IV pilus assembly protein PilW
MPTLVIQKGLSLIELLIAMAISSFLILGVTQIYLDNKRSYSFQQNQAENLEGARYLLMLMQQELAKTGYRRRPDETLETAFPAMAANTSLGCSAFTAGQTVLRTANNSLCIRYQPRDDQDRDCLGDLPANAASLVANGPYTEGDEVIIERLYFEYDDSSSNGSLRCTRMHTSKAGSILSGRGVTSAELISGVADLRLELGTGTSADTRSITQYTSAATTNPILAVRYSVLLKGPQLGQRESISTDTALASWQSLVNLADDDEQLSSISEADKRHLYQVSQSTVVLRNLLP